MRRFGNASPERTKVWTEPPPKHHQQHLQQQQQQNQKGQLQGRKVPVVYYLCRNRHLEHPHFIEVPTSSPDGLFLRDVINRLNALRGKGVTASYSWSCKRSYKSGFVWHDLSEDDLVLPTNGDEYVLKGSEILDSSPSGRPNPAPSNPKLAPPPEIPSPSTSRSQETSPSSRSPAMKPPARAPEDELSTSMANASAFSSPSPSPGEYRVHRAMGAADAATQTEERERDGAPKKTKNHGRTHGRTISTEEFTELQRTRTPRSTKSCELIRDEIPSPLNSNFSPSGKIDTLESLIRADASRNLNSFRILEEEIPVAAGSAKMKPINVLMQLITCGSISIKGHHSLGLVPRYRPAFSHADFPSPQAFSGSMMMGELNGLSKSPRFMEGKPRGSSLEEQGEEEPSLKLSSSTLADWSPKSPLPSGEESHVAADQAHSKRLPKSLRFTGSKNSKNNGAPPRSPLSSLNSPSWDPSKANGSSRMNSFQKEKEKVFKIDERRVPTTSLSLDLFLWRNPPLPRRLTSGARVVIQSTPQCHESDDSNDGS